MSNNCVTIMQSSNTANEALITGKVSRLMRLAMLHNNLYSPRGIRYIIFFFKHREIHKAGYLPPAVNVLRAMNY